MVGSIAVLVLFGWLFAIIATLVKFSSKGNILYSQQRIGKGGEEFTIYKFRTMIANAEQNGPELSHNNDSRVTKIGHYLRRIHLDELPQFYNVLIGDMSIVGTRPERKFYIEQIVQKAPQYKTLLQYRPGITSWGQLKYGYAENVEQMIERFQYDLDSTINFSLLNDLKILLSTFFLLTFNKKKLS